MKDNWKFILLLIVFMSFFRPIFVEQEGLETINMLYLRLIQDSTVGIIAIYFFRLFTNKKRVSTFTIILLVLSFWLLFSTLISEEGSVSAFITMIYPVLAISMFVEMLMDKNSKLLFSVISTGLGIYILLNFIFRLIQPYDHTPNLFLMGSNQFFMGCRNQQAPLYIVAVVVAVIEHQYKKTWQHRLYLCTLLAVCTFMIHNGGSGSNTIAWTVVLLLFIINFLVNDFGHKYLKFEKYRQYIAKMLDFRVYIIGYIITFISIMFFNIQNLFERQLHNILGKNATLSGRIYIWEAYKEMIAQQPFLGYGIGRSMDIISFDMSYFNPHNQTLMLLIWGGFTSLFILICLFYIVGKKLIYYKEEKSMQILSIGILGILIVLFTETMGFLEILLLLAIAYHLPKTMDFKIQRLDRKKKQLT